MTSYAKVIYQIGQNTLVVQKESSYTQEVSSILAYFIEQKLVSPESDLTELAGDASNRRYYRIFDRAAQQSFVVMKNATDAFKSEEAGASGQKVHELDFVVVGKAWKERGIHVPQIFHIKDDSSLLLLQDLGDRLLFQDRQESKDLKHYKMAIDQLVEIQKMQAFEPIASRRFSRELLEWELHHFEEWAIQERKIQLSATSQAQLQSLFQNILESMSRQPFVVCHRDFHSKNILIHEGIVFLIDFQDALMGPATYDLASLLRDSYVQLDESEETDLIDYYQACSPLSWDQELYELTSLQRNLKAAGRFFYIDLVKKKPTHLPFVNPTMNRIEATLMRLGLAQLGRELKEKIYVD